jgi:hypothetical protein
MAHWGFKKEMDSLGLPENLVTTPTNWLSMSMVLLCIVVWIHRSSRKKVANR